MQFQAHKGVSTENPENTLCAFASAIRQGYSVIELDPGVTKDLQVVTLHDRTLNRTARHPDGRELEQPVAIREITYAQAQEYDFGIGFSRKFRGTKLPLLSEALKMAASAGIKVKIDNKYQSFSPEEREALFSVLRGFEKTAMLTCSRVEEIRSALQEFPQMEFHYDGPVTEESLRALSALLPKERLTVWMPHPDHKAAWITVDHASPELAAAVKPAAKLGIWILSTEQQLLDAEALGADIIETNGQLKPVRRTGVLPDTHNHTAYSHDSMAPMQEVCRAHAEKGLSVMTITEHLDVYGYPNRNDFPSALQSYLSVQALRPVWEDSLHLFAGVEISGVACRPELGRKAEQMAPYDEIIGSVHYLLQNEKPASLKRTLTDLDAAQVSEETFYPYLDTYFEEILTMLDFADFDILAHLTLPLRVIYGAFHRKVDLSRYAETIDQILKKVIAKGIALELNTSAYAQMGCFMPDRSILARYRELGGCLVTLASDAHVPQAAGQYFPEATALLRELGFRYVCYFDRRNLLQCTLA